MSGVIWLTPTAWWGIAVLSVPVAIHLLTRQQARHELFPSLRFLRATRTSAVRHRLLHEPLLLAIRVLTLAAAVAALAGPLFLSESRQRAWAERVARAIVVSPHAGVTASRGALERALDGERAGSFQTRIFTPERRAADGFQEAVTWLDAAPPASRELVIIGNLSEGSVTPGDLGMVPEDIGIRLTPVTVTSQPPSLDSWILDGSDDSVRARRANVQLLDAATTVQLSPPIAGTMPLIVRASANEQALADAAVRVLLHRGLELGRSLDRRVIVLFEGVGHSDLDPLTRPVQQPWMRRAMEQLPDLTAAQREDVLVISVPLHATDASVVHVLDRIARVAFGEDRQTIEPRQIPATTLAAWSRPLRFTPPVNPQSDEGDRRWLWAAVLALIVAEQVMRRSRSRDVADHDAVAEEQRVA